MSRVRVLTAAGHALVEDDRPKNADCILVLGGDDFGTRILTGALLAQAGYASRVFVDGTPSLDEWECDKTIHYAVGKGFSPSLFHPVRLPPGVDSTGTEVKYVANTIFKKNNFRRILLVTSNYHTRRAARFLRRVAPWLDVCVIAAPDPFFTPDSWWKTRNGKKTFLLEWTKTITEWWSS